MDFRVTDFVKNFYVVKYRKNIFKTQTLPRRLNGKMHVRDDTEDPSSLGS